MSVVTPSKRRRVSIILTTVFLAAFGPFVCNNPDVEKASAQLRNAEAENAITTLTEVKDDAPEVHLARGIGYLNLEKHEEARGALDQAYRIVAERDAKATSEAQVEENEDRPPKNPTSDALRARLAFANGLVAIAEEKWEDALIEFGRVLIIEPDDEDARWNMELSWHMANPACHKREDDHEPDNDRENAGPYDPEKSTERLLCPGNEDWYTFEAPADTMLYVTLEGEIDTSDEGHRQVGLSLYAPKFDRAIRTAPMKDGKAILGLSGIREKTQFTLRIGGPGNAEVKYALRVEPVPPCPVDDAFEENDDSSTPHELADGEHGGLKACPGDPDWYQVKVPADEARQLDIAFEPSRAPLHVVLMELDGVTERAVARSSKAGLSITIPKTEEEQTLLVKLVAETEKENSYGLKFAPPQDNEGEDEQDEKEQQDEQDQQDQQDQQDEQDQQDQQDQKEQEQPQQMDLDALLEELEKQEKNPQLEKALRNLRVVPQMEDY